MSALDKFKSRLSGVNLPINGVRLPEYSVEPDDLDRFGIKRPISNFDFLKKIAWEGAKVRGITRDDTPYIERLKYELEILEELSFTDYILLVWDVINFCRKNSIPTGRGRGSAAGSLVLYCIGVTGLDPIKHNLYFERFVSRVRAKKKVVDGVIYLDGSLMVDVDLDICYYRRGEVIQYLNEKFRGNTSKILTLNTLSGKLLMKECGKVVSDKSESEMNRVSEMIPKQYGNVMDIDQAYAQEEEFREWCDENSDVFYIAKKLKNLIKNKGVHASGYLVSHDKLIDVCPSELDSNKDVVCSYDMNWVALINVKLDLLGLRSVSVVDDVCRQLGIREEDLDVDDPYIYQNLQELKLPHGLFQIEADTNFRVCQKVKPKNVEELSAVLALGRPASLQFVAPYAKYSNTGEAEDLDVESDKLKSILLETGNCVLFQETIMRICKEVFGFSLDQAELVRRACAKKKKEEMDKFQDLLFKNAKESGLPKSAEFFWKVMVDSADYGFNKCVFEEAGIYKYGESDQIPIKEIKVGDWVLAYDTKNCRDHYVRVKGVIRGRRDLFLVKFLGGNSITCSGEHKFLSGEMDAGMMPLWEIFLKDHDIQSKYENETIDSITLVGEMDTYDLEVDHPDHNFYANDLVTSNSHAVSYACLAAETVLLKNKYPLQFFLSLLKMSRHEPDPIGEISKIHREMKKMGIPLLPPHIVKSGLDFQIEGNAIRFGLLSIKGISDKSMEKINEFICEGKSKFEIFESAKDCGLNIGVLSCLIQAGALTGYCTNRSYLVYESQLWNVLTDREKPIVSEMGAEFDYKLVPLLKALKGRLNEKGKPIIRDTRFDTIQKKSAPYREIYEQNRRSETFANWWYENSLLGYSYSSTLKEIFGRKNPEIISLREVKECPDKTQVLFVGKVEESHKKTSRAGAEYIRLTVSDESEAITVMVFNNQYAQNMDQCLEMNGGLPEKKSIVVVKGTVRSSDSVFAEVVSVQSNKIYTKLADLKNNA